VSGIAMRIRSFWPAVVVATTVATAYAFTCGGGPLAPRSVAAVGASASAPQNDAAPTPAVVAAPASAPPAPAAEASQSPRARFPGGTSLAPLNGVRESIDMPWPAGRPFSAVAGIVHDRGQDWYKHADGSWSTTTIDPNDPAHSIGLVFTPEEVRPTALRGR
jgi:hypothetical protein